MAEILHEDGDTRLVRLSQEYYSGDDQLVQTHARFTEHCAVISRCFSISGKPKSFMLNADEMEELTNAWIAYQNDMREKAEAEAKRLADVEREAYRLAEKCKAIQIEKKETEGKSLVWHVTIPDFGWGYEYIHDADTLLSAVTKAIEYCRPIQEAYRLAKDYPINFDHQNGSDNWWITINDLFGELAEQKTIVSVVQQAIKKYKQHQDKLIKESN
jgi:hypothetical protein